MSKVSKETIELIIQFVGEGNNLGKSFKLAEDIGNTTCSTATFYKKIKEFKLEAEYYEAFETRRKILEEKVLEEAENIPEIIASEFFYQEDRETHEVTKHPTKFINNTTGIQKLELKRKIIAQMNGHIRRYKLIEGEKLNEQIESIKNAVACRELESGDAKNIMDILDKEVTLTKFDQLQKDIADVQYRQKIIEARSK